MRELPQPAFSYTTRWDSTRRPTVGGKKVLAEPSLRAASVPRSRQPEASQIRNYVHVTEERFVWPRHEFPWLGRTMFPAVADSYFAALSTALAGFGSEIVEVDGARQIDEASFWREITCAFSMPDYFSNGWDAFDDCWLDDRSQMTRLAVLWKSAGAGVSQDRAVGRVVKAAWYAAGTACTYISSRISPQC
ncbi:MAG: hypothetical protein QOG97_3699 [Acidimicrobiaceae bacterium]|nr:hypothetical protein [Acidimicrobiaceae bacterium]